MKHWWVIGAICMGAWAQAFPSVDVSVVLPPRFESAYFKLRPEKFLVDPQRVLSREEFKEQLEFLNYHSGDSAIDLVVYVFPGNQVLPGNASVEPLIDRVFADGKPAVVVHYFMGRPERSALYLNPPLDDIVPLADQGRALEAAVTHAAAEPMGVRQLDKFMVQMSIQIYWMERLLKQADADKRQEGGVEVLPRESLMDAEEPSIKDMFLKLSRSYGVLVGAVFVLLVLLLVVRLMIQRRARYRFVDLEVEPRLGGAHCAGVGAVLSFASATLPPASQRER